MKYFTKEWYARMQQMGNCGSQEEWERLRPEIEAPMEAYHTYLEQEGLTAIDQKLNYHDWRVLHAQRDGNDFCLFLGYATDTPSVRLRFVDTQVFGQELSGNPNADYVWLYHELYLTATGYQLQLLLAEADGLYEWSIQCARMELTEVKE